MQPDSSPALPSSSPSGITPEVRDLLVALIRKEVALPRPPVDVDGRLRGARTSAEIGELLAALAMAQGEIESAKKDKTNPAFANGSGRGKYADLAACFDACRVPLAKNGLTVIQIPRVDLSGDRTVVVVVTVLGHKSGQWLESSLSMPAQRSDAQGIGAAISYARRYALMPIVGIAPDDDDDGNSASGTHVPERTPPKRQEAPPPAASAKDDAWADAADLLSARIVDVPSLEALQAIAGEVKGLPQPFQGAVKKIYEKRYRELRPATASGGAS